MKTISTTKIRISFSKFHELIKITSNKDETHRVIILFKQMALRKYQFTTETSKLLVPLLVKKNLLSIIDECKFSFLTHK